jgi:regulator of sigma E protease
MSHIFSLLYVAAGVVFLFGAAIFVHEFGHFWVARWRGLKVEEFAIGFGPKIFSWTRQGIVYSVRWIPAGGFVKLPQMITSEALEGGSKTKPVPEPTVSAASKAVIQAITVSPVDDVPLPPVSALSKILVAAAGPAMNVVFAFAIATLIYFVGLPVHVNPPIIGYVDPKSPEGKMGIQQEDRVVAIDGQPVKSWDEIFHTTILALTNVFQVTIVRGGNSNVYTLTAEANNGVMGVKTLNLDPKDHLEVGETTQGSPAAAAGLQAGDEIVAFAGAPISSHEQFTNLVQAFGGKKTALVVKRGNRPLTVELTPVFDKSLKAYLLGIRFAPGRDVFAIEHPTPWAQVRDVWEQLSGTISALVHWRDSGVRASDLSGPVGIASMLAVEVKSDYRLALHFLVMLNLNLALLNMLPIPVLDGGHILMAILEKIRRRPMEVRFLEYTTTVFAVLLISFMLYITFFDIKRIPLLHILFNRQTQIEQPENSKETPPVPENRPAPVEPPAQPAAHPAP